MYLDFYGLKELPFSIAPDPRYLYMSERHREALAHLLFGVNGQGGFVVLTGEVGTGKTTICRCFLNQVPKNTDVAFIINPKLSARELMASICDELNIPYAPSASIKILNDAINHYLLQAHSDGRHTVLIIDEAQNLRVDVLEQLRLLTNLETSEKKLLQIILLGQPELKEMLAQTDLRQLAQRVTARYHLNELNRVEVGAYVKCRLMVAGRATALFSTTAVNQLFKLSGGVPRLINLIADRALLGAYACHAETIDPQHVKQAYKEIQGETGRRTWYQPKKAALFVGMVCSIMLVGGLSLLSYSALKNRQMLTDNEAEIDQFKTVTEQALSDRQKIPDRQVSNRPNNDKPTEVAALVAAVPSVSKTATATTVMQASKNNPVEPFVEAESPTPIAADLMAEYSDQAKKQDSRLDALATLGQIRNSEHSKFFAYQSIYKQWGVYYPEEPFMLACEYAALNDLSCLHKQGNWRSLLRLDRPAVLSLMNDDGEEVTIALLKIDDGRARIAHDGSAFWVTMDEIDRHWLGEYSLLWRLPDYQSRTIRPGALPEKAWLRQRLQEIAGSKRFKHFSVGDPEQEQSLEHLVKRFQKAVGLEPDGIVGSMTLIHINSVLNTGAPSLLSKG